ncbi:hypothetical protein SSX86_003028 [Deinandra increscens subsp. villosa]|uniref:Uncharacterized protein n=1 Tax=Deinandra increscens subsp. villosa TaxID=3103831 RepID=A0AAP0DGF5_9ASTR
MGNSLSGADRGKKKKAKVMKIDGEIFKLTIPVKVFQVIKDYPAYVLLESTTFKRFGIRANPLDPEEFLEAGKVYFLVELPKLPESEKKEVMSSRSVSEVPVVRAESGGGLDECGSVQVKVRLPKAEVDKLVRKSIDDEELAERIVDFYVRRRPIRRYFDG